MKNNKVYITQSEEKPIHRFLEESPSDIIVPCGFRVRTNIHAGAWWCNSCEGKTEGSQLIQPNCDYCQVS